MDENRDMTLRLLLQRIDDIGQNVSELRSGQSDATKRANEDSIKIERVLGEIRALNSLADSVKSISDDVDRHEVRLCLLEEQAASREKQRTEQQHEQRITKLEGWQMKVVGIMAVLIVIVQLVGSGLVRAIWGK